MTHRMPVELTDGLIELMLTEEAGRGTPTGLVADIVSAVGTTPQGRAGLLPRLTWPQTAGRRSTWLVVGALLLVGLTIAAALIGSLLQRKPAPLGGGPLIVYQVRGSFADIYTLDVANGAETPLGSVQLTSEIGGQRIQWSADGRHAFVSGDGDRIQAQLDLVTHEVTPVDAGQNDAQQASPAGDRVASLAGDAATGFTLSVVDMTGAEVVRVPLPTGAEVFDSIVWTPDGSAVLLSGCLPCDQKNVPSPADHEHLFLVPLDGSPIRQLTDETSVLFGYPSFSPDGSTIVYSSALCRDTCTGGISTVAGADGRMRPLTDSGRDAAPAWSPDGTRIAFQRGGEDGGIYVMDRDGSHLLRLTTTPGSDVIHDSAPIWAPNGSSIAFTRDITDTTLGDLWLVPSAGGEARLLARNAVADWGPTAAQIAALSPGSASPPASPAASAVVVPPSASASEPVTAAPSAGSGSNMPGGGPLMVFQLDGTMQEDAKTETAYTVDLGTGQQTRIGAIPIDDSTCCPSSVRWTADRRRVLLSSLDLLAIADPDAGTLERVRRPPAGQFKPAISQRGDRIARVDEVSGSAPTIVISDLAGKELSRVRVSGVRVVFEMAWSPDDSAIAVVGCGPCDGDPEPGNQRLILVGLDGSGSRELMSGGRSPASPTPSAEAFASSAFYAPAWSPDGRRIVLVDQDCISDVRLRTEDCTGRLLSVDVATGRTTVLETGDGTPGAPSWSPDGTRLAFPKAATDGSRLGLFVMDVATGKSVGVADGDGPADWSPDGTWLEFPRDNGVPDTDRLEVWVVRVDGSGARRIAEHAVAGW